jgi:hypothetical protein
MENGKKVSRVLLERRMALGLTAAMLAIVSWSAPSYARSNTQLAELYQLQAAFHWAGTVQDPVNGDSAAVIDQRIRDMLALWTDDGSLTFQVGAPLDGDYVGNGDPADPSTCPAPSGDPTNRGTLCTFFKYVAGSFQPANKFVSLAPSYLTEFGIQGNTATVYFQCHFFNVAINPATGKPFWTAASHLVFEGTATKVQGTWLFSQASVPLAGVPIP